MNELLVVTLSHGVSSGQVVQVTVHVAEIVHLFKPGQDVGKRLMPLADKNYATQIEEDRAASKITPGPKSESRHRPSQKRTFSGLNLAASNAELLEVDAAPAPTIFSRAYTQTVVMARLHQAHFRKATLKAYRSRCCVCELNEHKLLDAAHIVPDRLPEGVAEIRNGMSMCPTHHRAYDRGVLLVKEDFTTEVRRDRLTAADSNETKIMLLDYAGRSIVRPKNEALGPDPELLRRKLELVA